MVKKTVFSKLFRESPFVSVQRHMEFGRDAVGQLSSLLKASYIADWVLVEDIYDAISKIENHADELKREIRISLPRGLFLPVYRTDLLELIQLQDQKLSSQELEIYSNIYFFQEYDFRSYCVKLQKI